MNLVADFLIRRLSGDIIAQISQKVGADESAVGKGVSAAVPLLLSALARNSADADGAQALHQAISKDHDGGILGNIAGFLGDESSANGSRNLSHILGGARAEVETSVAQASGLPTSSTGKLLKILAPLILGAIGKLQREQGLDAGGLVALLSGDAHPGAGALGMINNLLDQDKDGSALDDIAGIAGKLFGK